jgi:hypothetical protein
VVAALCWRRKQKEEENSSSGQADQREKKCSVLEMF